ncbi:single-stranded-DNA-specific exonuclease RecJ [candidate division CPR3 bacterium GWE2_35_7]|nr:MAG: single-stranded-DNA-specific exonuclease RecJ [candidate division CPR3 bacterium GWE2_35_7]
MNKAAVKRLANEKIGLIITVDCGITGIQEVEIANSLGIDVIITDHHQKGKRLPKAFAIIHDDTLVGVSVAWTLAMGVKREFPNQKFESKINDLDLVAIGTIADLQPLLFKNRSFVKWGLQALNKTERLGLRMLIDQADLPWGEIDTYHVGYIIAPRLNATGRLQDGLSAVRLLCTKDELQALELTDSLSKLNTQRQELTITSFEEAEMQIKVSDNKKVLVLTHESWHEGIVGLVASRIKEKYYRPTLAISTQGKVGKGSARSIKGFNIINALREMEDLLIDCGGHPMAAGFTIELNKVEEFKKRLEEFTEKYLEPTLLEPLLEIDAEVKLSDLNWEFKKIVDKFRPFGVENPEPIFLIRNITVTHISLIGKIQNHLKFKIGNLEGLGFGLGYLFPEVIKNPKMDIAFSLNESFWNGNKKLFLKIKDLHLIP